MTNILRSQARRPLVLVAALAAALALMSVIAPRADAAKPDQILDAKVMTVNQLTCEVKIDTMLNRRGSMKNQIEVVVAGTGTGFTVAMDAKRGATLRVEESLGGPGVYSGVVMSRNPRTGEVAQTINLGVFGC